MPKLEPSVLVQAVKRANTPKGYPVFIETGTHVGRTSRMVSSMVKKVYTVEVDEKLYNRAADLFKGSNVEVLKGDSLDVLPTLLNDVKDNIIFWLDGHNSGPGTGVGRIDFPLLQECQIIDSNLQSKEALILADDVRMFGHGHKLEIDDSLRTISIGAVLSAFKRLRVIDHWFADSGLAKDDRLIIHVTTLPA
jgi:hypothetical protein